MLAGRRVEPRAGTESSGRVSCETLSKSTCAQSARRFCRGFAADHSRQLVAGSPRRSYPLMTRAALRSLWDLCFRSLESEVKMTRVAGAMKRLLVGHLHQVRARRMLYYWYLRHQPGRLPRPGMTIATCCDAGCFRVFCKQIAGQRCRTVGRPSRFQRRKSCQLRCRLGRVMTRSAGNCAGTVNAVFAAVVFSVVKSDLSEFCLVPKNDHIRHCFFLSL